MLSEKEYQLVIIQFRKGEKKAIEKIYDAYGNALYGVIIRMVNSPEKANELLQDTFMKVWTNRSSYSPDISRLYTWMLRIARNLSINYLQSKEYKSAALIQTDENIVYLNEPGRLNQNSVTMDLRGKVTELEDRYQEVIEWIYFKGYTHQEVSDELNIPLGTVKSRLKIGLRKLREIYDYNILKAVVALLPIMKLTLL